MNTTIFEIDELPLVMTGESSGALINGEAEIAYARNGDWWIESVSVEGWEGGKRLMLPAPDKILTIMCQRLEGEWLDAVQNHVNEQIEKDRESAADDYADMRRDMMREREI